VKQGFNLLKAQVEAPTVWTKVYDWVVGTARLVVIAVEIAVVVAFAIRLIVDVQSAKLDEEIKSKETRVSYIRKSGELEKYNRIQTKTKSFEYMWTESQIFSEIYMNINRYLPNNFIEGSVSVDKTRISIAGKATVIEIERLEKNLKNSAILKGVELKNIETQGSSPTELAEFSIIAHIRESEMRVVK